MLTLGFMELESPVEETHMGRGKDDLWQVGRLIITTTGVARLSSRLGGAVAGGSDRHRF